MRTVSTFVASSPMSPAAVVQRSPWHSPAPYLFAGVAAMLLLITFALVILACSYWKNSGYPRENGDDDQSQSQSQSDIEAGAGEKSAADMLKVLPVFEEKIVVIMAGDLNPTFLATPVSSRSNSFGGGDKCEQNFEMESEDSHGQSH
ncbi:protein GLUTAMINE DUMPER 5-like [Nicotiana tabacum]|uniref:Protein GLUTAMINE DUMPER 2-like n=1 Tax=Nicotiana tabacum TaxID=4097 RepID=A0A1S3YVJ6_TOBAC|nr:protein GLUTAMINE DUMPER 2-like [Nicotiana tomentosiformis]XP_016456184.1 PREDICTED: protein GLUTAMINE DUMPER 2-like [Nicotiana tabacum]